MDLSQSKCTIFKTEFADYASTSVLTFIALYRAIWILIIFLWNMKNWFFLFLTIMRKEFIFLPFFALLWPAYTSITTRKCKIWMIKKHIQKLLYLKLWNIKTIMHKGFFSLLYERVRHSKYHIFVHFRLFSTNTVLWLVESFFLSQSKVIPIFKY